MYRFLQKNIRRDLGLYLVGLHRSGVRVHQADVKKVRMDMDDYGNGTFKRIKKDSFDYYRQVIESNGTYLE